MIGRNVDDHFAKTPTPHFPRSRFDMGIHKRVQTQGHGRLYPFYCRMVYPGDTWQMDMSTFVRADTSSRVPLDDIFLDTYWFFIPLRILDDNFPKVLGEGEPEDYDDVSYGFPLLEIVGGDASQYSIDNLLSYLGYSTASVNYDSVKNTFDYSGINGGDEITPYALASVYKVYNDWFRDENLDPSIPYTDLYNAHDYDFMSGTNLFQETNEQNEITLFDALKVNRYHDYFASSVIAPQKGPAVTIPLGTSAPVGLIASSSGSVSTGNLGNISPFYGSYSEGKLVGLHGSSTLNGLVTSNTPIVADLSNAAGTINELRLAFAIQSLYERRGRFGTRYIETIRGQWGIEVPDSFFLRPEYLGGNRVCLNNIPVLSTENSSQLGQMAGNSSTLSNGGSWSKTFIEYGLILGLSCTRVKHSYTQGKRKELFSLKTQLDLYNPVFANIGYQPIYTYEIYNDPDNVPVDDVFGYQEPWAYLRSEEDSFAGLFGVMSDNSNIKNLWHYGDYYASKPHFSASWLKEDANNVARTLTGQLIAGAPNTSLVHKHQFMFAYFYHPIVTRILPTNSIPAELLGRL